MSFAPGWSFGRKSKPVHPTESMAFQAGQARRHRSSTTASRGLNADEQTSAVASLLTDLAAHLAPEDEESFEKTGDVALELRHELATSPGSKDIFRRASGFEIVLTLLFRLCAPEDDKALASKVSTRAKAVLRHCLSLLGEAFLENHGNERYFCGRLDGWSTLQFHLQAYLDGMYDAGVEDDADFNFDRKSRLRDLLSALLELTIGKHDYDLIAQQLLQIDDKDISESEQTQVKTLKGNEAMPQPQAGALLVRVILRCLNRDSDGKASDTYLPRSFLRIVVELTGLSIRNSIALWQTGILSDLLQAVLDKQKGPEMQLLVQPLLDSMLYLGIEQLDDVALLYQRACETDYARDTLLAALELTKGPAFVHFDLSQHGYSSVELPCLPRVFPPSIGYTLTAWLRIDEFDPTSHTTIFGAFDSTQTCFILAYLEQDSHQLILQTSIRSAQPSVRFKSVRFEAGRWYHVAIVHRQNATEPRQSSAVLFVDGEFAEQLKCTYPERPQEVEVPNPPPSKPSRRTPAVQAFFGTPHDLSIRLGRDQIMSKWSLATAHLYQTPLTDEFIAVHHRLGWRYFGNLQDCLGPLLTYRASAELKRYNEVLHPDKSDKSDLITATEGPGGNVVPESKLLFAFGPSSIVGSEGSGIASIEDKYELSLKSTTRYQSIMQKTKAFAINSAVTWVNDAITRTYGIAILTGDPMVAACKGIDDASWCLAGCLPLLTLLVESANTKQTFLQAIKIFFGCVSDSWRISEAMEKGNGFGVLAVIIREKLGLEPGGSAVQLVTRKPSTMLSREDRESMPLELLHLVLEFVGYKRDNPEDSLIVNPMAYRVLLIDFDTWRRCDLDTQALYYSQYVHFVLRNKHAAFNNKRLARVRVIKRLIDAMKTEEVMQASLDPLRQAIKALTEGSGAPNNYRELAMFVVFALQDGRAQQLKPLRNMASAVRFGQRAAHWAKVGRATRPSTPGSPSVAEPRSRISRAELGVSVLEMLTTMLCEARSASLTRRFIRAVPIRWMLHSFAESDPRVVTLTSRIVCCCVFTLGSEFKYPFMDKDGGLIAMKARLKGFWRDPALWTSCFATMFARAVPIQRPASEVSLYTLLEDLQVDETLSVTYPDLFSVITTLLEAGLREVVEKENPTQSEVKLVTTFIHFLGEAYTRSPGFREFAANSLYLEELLFVLYPVVVGSDRLAAETEYQAEKDALSFKGEEVTMRPHSNSLGERPPSVRSLSKETDGRSASPRSGRPFDAPRRLSSFVLVSDSSNSKPTVPPTKFSAAIAPKASAPVQLNVGNSIVESLLEVCVNLFVDQVCTKKDFTGLGLFLKVPPGFREHQAYFESYVLVHALSQLWNHLQLNQNLFRETKVLTNLGRYALYMSEAVFEGWFINGAQPLMDFIGKALDYLQQPGIAADKNVRLCAQATTTMRIVFLRATLLRLSELDETVNEAEAITLLDQMNYWQTILFSSENQETPFIRLICFLLYMKLTSSVQSVRLAAARLWRTMLVQKPTETATLLTYAMGSTQRHLSTGFMKLVSVDDEDFIKWVDNNRSALDSVFIDALARPWEDFVSEENRRNEDSAKVRLSKRREKLRKWQTDDAFTDDSLHRYEVSTNHWRANVHAQERMKLQRALQDLQESSNHLFAIFTELDKRMHRPGGLQPMTELQRWQLDPIEAGNRMRMRLMPDTSSQSGVFQSKKKYAERNLTSQPTILASSSSGDLGDAAPSAANTPAVMTADGAVEDGEDARPRSQSISNSQLLEGSFELVDDPHQDEDGMVEDKNRKIMTSLLRGDVVQQLYNISRIVGLEACEGLLVIGKDCLYMQDNFFQRSDGEIVSVSQAPEDERDPYLQLISGQDVGTQRTKHSNGDHTTRHWLWTEVLSISKRRFLFRNVSLEVFFTDGRSYLLTCMTTKVRDELYNAIVGRAPHIHSTTTVASEDAWRLDNLRNPEETPQSLGSRFANVFSGAATYTATKKWARGQMSNFQYLMLVNTMAGRSFNDLTQYPVFPWVLADYSSDVLDLNDPKTFRNFAKPMGCQTEAREEEFKDRYQQFADMADETAPPFNYGTHYSSAMIVSSYLIRLQPFVQSYLLLQGGAFDHADRLFDSIEKAWLSSSRDNMGDVREVIPEFYYLPEFLMNSNHFDFGLKQGDGSAVDDVKLPKWAKGDPYLFITKHREALESKYVSDNLHQWIDLVFGYKSRGEAAVEATNVFQHLSYGGAKDLDTITDPIERLATIGIIHSFGQTPLQVFQRAHPPREVEKFAVARLDRQAESLTQLPIPIFETDEKVASLTFLRAEDRLLCSGPCRLDLLPTPTRFLQWGFADDSIRFFSSNSKRLLGLYENVHVGAITAATFADSKTLITAGADCTLAIWGVKTSRDLVGINSKAYLHGHRAPVCLITASRVLSTLLSVSTDGQVLVWDLNRHECLRVLIPAGGGAIQAITISPSTGHILICRGPSVLLFTLNGHLLLEQKVCDSIDDRMACCAFYPGAGNEWVERELVCTGHAYGVANVYALTTLSDGTWHLQLVNRLNHIDSSREDGGNIPASVTAILPVENSVYTGDSNGKVWEWTAVQRRRSSVVSRR